MSAAAAAIVEIPSFVRSEFGTNLATQMVAAGYTPAEAKRHTAANLPHVLTTIQQYLDAKALELEPGEELVVHWDVLLNTRIEVEAKPPASNAAALLKALTALQSNAAQPKAAIAAVPVAAKADTSGGMTPEQLAQLIGAVASAAAQGAATGAQVKPAQTTVEIETQDVSDEPARRRQVVDNDPHMVDPLSPHVFLPVVRTAVFRRNPCGRPYL